MSYLCNSVPILIRGKTLNCYSIELSDSKLRDVAFIYMSSSSYFINLETLSDILNMA